MTRQHLVCYVPVLHQGYLDFFASYPDAEIHVMGGAVLGSRFDYLRKDIRALKPAAVTMLLNGMGRKATEVKTESQVKDLFQKRQVIVPDDDISHTLAEKFGAHGVVFVPVFLRWDRKSVDTNTDVKPDKVVTLPAADPIVEALYAEAGKSTNWWRNVGAALVSGDKVTALAHNGSVPTEYSSAIDGDPRILANRGSAIDTSVDIHAESRLIGQAASRGDCLAEKAIYVSTFPCPTCAKLIAASGIRKCYFIEGYATLDGQSILKANAIEIIKIDTEATPSNTRQRAQAYPDA